MKKARIVIVDSDFNYIVPLQLKFIEEFFDKIDLEIITSEEYFRTFCSVPQQIEVLILAEEFYEASINRHDIGKIFVMTEQPSDNDTTELNINKLYKYTSIAEIFNEIIGISAEILNIQSESTEKPQIIVVYSASGGAGKTTIALGMCGALSKTYKKVLYMNASRIQSFQRWFVNQSSISNNEVYMKCRKSKGSLYSEIKHVIRYEKFFYLPPFKGALVSLGMPYSVFRKIAAEARTSREYNYVVIDADNVYDEDKVELLNIADKVVIVVEQTENSVYATNMLISNIDVTNKEKYIFICNQFDAEKNNALVNTNIDKKFAINEYVKHINHFDSVKSEDLAKNVDIQKILYML